MGRLFRATGGGRGGSPFPVTEQTGGHLLVLFERQFVFPGLGEDAVAKPAGRFREFRPRQLAIAIRVPPLDSLDHVGPAGVTHLPGRGLHRLVQRQFRFASPFEDLRHRTAEHLGDLRQRQLAIAVGVPLLHPFGEGPRPTGSPRSGSTSARPLRHCGSHHAAEFLQRQLGLARPVEEGLGPLTHRLGELFESHLAIAVGIGPLDHLANGPTRAFSGGFARGGDFGTDLRRFRPLQKLLAGQLPVAILVADSQHPLEGGFPGVTHLGCRQRAIAVLIELIEELGGAFLYDSRVLRQRSVTRASQGDQPGQHWHRGLRSQKAPQLRQAIPGDLDQHGEPSESRGREERMN